MAGSEANSSGPSTDDETEQEKTSSELEEKLDKPESSSSKPNKEPSIFDELEQTFGEATAAEVGEEVEARKEVANELNKQRLRAMEEEEEGSNPFAEAGPSRMQRTRATITNPPAGATSDIDEMMARLGITDEPVGSSRIDVGEEPPSILAQSTTPRGASTRKSINPPLADNSPEADFVRLLVDAGISRGKAYIAQQFFKKPNDAQWLNTVMAEAGVSPNKRRMIIMGWFSDTPEALGVNINKTAAAPNGSADNEDDLEKTLDDLEKDQVKDVKRLTIKRRADELREELGLPARGKAGKKGTDDNEELVEVPLKDASGKFMKDNQGRVITVKLSKTQLYWQSLEDRERAPKEASSSDKFYQMMMAAEKERAEERRANDERFNKMMSEMDKTRKESNDKLLGYVLKNEREENDRLRKSYMSKGDVLDSLDDDIARLERLGLVRADKDTPLDQQTKLVKESREGVKDIYGLGRSDVKEVFGWLREDMREERRNRHPELVEDSKVSEKEKDDFYEQIKRTIPPESLAKPSEKQPDKPEVKTDKPEPKDLLKDAPPTPIKNNKTKPIEEYGST